MSVVIDTNVAVVANDRETDVSSHCVTACVDALLQIRDQHCVLIDNLDLILDEYRVYLRPAGEPGAGDAFFKWLWDNQGNLNHCRRIEITPNASGSFDEFPTAPVLNAFDKSDRKFVAVALASGENPEILNACDSDWWLFQEALSAEGLTVTQLCPEQKPEI